MAYIGKRPIAGNFQKCDAITVVNGQAAYTLQVGSTNVTPESANHMLVSLNGVLQAPVTSFTVSSSTLTFASNLATGDVIDFVILLGNVLDLGTPSDNTVTTAKIADDAVTYAKATGFGKVLQVVTATDATERSSTSTSFATASSTLTLEITPVATSSKIFVIMTTAIRMTSADGCDFAIYRESTNTTGTSNGLTRISGIQDNYIGMTCSVLDSPSSTSAQTYQLYVKVAGGQIEINSGGRTGTITAFEIGA